LEKEVGEKAESRRKVGVRLASSGVKRIEWVE
jgi:hypothetical protein